MVGENSHIFIYFKLDFIEAIAVQADKQRSVDLKLSKPLQNFFF